MKAARSSRRQQHLASNSSSRTTSTRSSSFWNLFFVLALSQARIPPTRRGCHSRSLPPLPEYGLVGSTTGTSKSVSASASTNPPTSSCTCKFKRRNENVKRCHTSTSATRHRWQSQRRGQQTLCFVPTTSTIHRNHNILNKPHHYFTRSREGAGGLGLGLGGLGSFSTTKTQWQKQKRIPLPPLQMSLLPIPVSSLDKILTSRLPTPAQYASYWGRTSREQYNAFFEAFGVSFLGVFASYFLSFAIGQFVATILGMIAGSWILLGPELKAYQRNWELTGGRELVDPWHDNDEYYDDDDDPLFDFSQDEDKRGLYGTFYFGRIEHVCVVDYPLDPPQDEYALDEFVGYTMEEDEQERETGIPYSLRLRVTDATDEDEGRELQIHARMSEEYLDLEVGMPVCAVLLSTSQQFQTLAAITDFCIPDGGPTWVGDYPYLDRAALEEMFVKDRELWDYLRDEGRGKWDVNNLDNNLVGVDEDDYYY